MNELIRYMAAPANQRKTPYNGALYLSRQTAMLVAHEETERTGLPYTTCRVKLEITNVRWFKK